MDPGKITESLQNNVQANQQQKSPEEIEAARNKVTADEARKESGKSGLTSAQGQGAVGGEGHNVAKMVNSGFNKVAGALKTAGTAMEEAQKSGVLGKIQSFRRQTDSPYITDNVSAFIGKENVEKMMKPFGLKEIPHMDQCISSLMAGGAEALKGSSNPLSVGVKNALKMGAALTGPIETERRGEGSFVATAKRFEKMGNVYGQAKLELQAAINGEAIPDEKAFARKTATAKIKKGADEMAETAKAFDKRLEESSVKHMERNEGVKNEVDHIVASYQKNVELTKPTAASATGAKKIESEAVVVAPTKVQVTDQEKIEDKAEVTAPFSQTIETIKNKGIDGVDGELTASKKRLSAHSEELDEVKKDIIESSEKLKVLLTNTNKELTPDVQKAMEDLGDKLKSAKQKRDVIQENIQKEVASNPLMEPILRPLYTRSFAAADLLNNMVEAFEKIKQNAYQSRDMAIQFQAASYHSSTDAADVARMKAELDALMEQLQAVVSAVTVAASIIGGVDESAGKAATSACESVGHIIKSVGSVLGGPLDQAKAYLEALAQVYKDAASSAQEGAQSDSKIMDAILQASSKFTQMLATIIKAG